MSKRRKDGLRLMQAYTWVYTDGFGKETHGHSKFDCREDAVKSLYKTASMPLPEDYKEQWDIGGTSLCASICGCTAEIASLRASLEEAKATNLKTLDLISQIDTNGSKEKPNKLKVKKAKKAVKSK